MHDAGSQGHGSGARRQQRRRGRFGPAIAFCLTFATAAGAEFDDATLIQPELLTVRVASRARTPVGGHGISETISGPALGQGEPTGACMLGIDLGSSTGSTLWDIDPTTGTGSNPRLTGVTGLGGLAISPTGTLFAIRHFITDYGLYQLDQTTGTPTFVGSTGLDGLIEGGLDFHPGSGVLYGINGRANPGETRG